MTRPPFTFVALGSAAAGGRGAGNKSALLDRAAAAGLAVPRDMLLLDEAWNGALRAGFFSSRLFVDATDPLELAAALTEVWASALGQPGALRRDVLIMAMVAARTAGVAFAERDYEDDLVNYTTGEALHLRAGHGIVERVHPAAAALQP